MGYQNRPRRGIARSIAGVYLNSAGLVLVPSTRTGRRELAHRCRMSPLPDPTLLRRTRKYDGAANSRNVTVVCLCSCCRQPIPLPAIITRMELASSEGRDGEGDRVFSLRCRACEREMPYRVEPISWMIEGTPRSRTTRSHDRARMLRQQERMARAANG